MSQFTPAKIWDFAECLEFFKKALAEKRRALLRGAVDGINHEHQVRFLRGSMPGEANGIWIEALSGDFRALELEYRQKVGVEVSFSVDDATMFFDTVIEQRRRTLPWFERHLLLRAPSKMSVVQQRKDGRVWVPDNCGLKSRLCKVTVDSDQRTEDIIPGKVWDLSLSGASMICPVNAGHMALRQDEPLEFSLEYGKLSVYRVAGVCYARPLSARSVRLGLQFQDTDSVATRPDPGNEAGLCPMQQLLNDLRAANIRAQLYNERIAAAAG